VYGSIDLDSIIRQKIHHDVAGNYNRFDVLSLALNRTPLTAISELPAALSVESATLSPSPNSDQPAENRLTARDQPTRGMSELDNEDDHGETH
jgi:hypothetical protein